MARLGPQHCLNPTFVRTCKKPGVYMDGGGLRLRIMPNGSRSWIMRITIRGVRRDISIGPLATLPFHAVAVWPADIAVSTGLSTDADARVLDMEGRPIPGLYACGNDMASIMAGTYPGPGTNLGPAVVFAYRAAMHAGGSQRGTMTAR